MIVTDNRLASISVLAIFDHVSSALQRSKAHATQPDSLLFPTLTTTSLISRAFRNASASTNDNSPIVLGNPPRFAVPLSRPAEERFIPPEKAVAHGPRRSAPASVAVSVEFHFQRQSCCDSAFAGLFGRIVETD